MNKKIIWIAAISITLQIVYILVVRNHILERDYRNGFFFLLVIFYLLSIPLATYYFITDKKLFKDKFVDIISLFFSFPTTILLLALFFVLFPKYKDITNSEAIQLYREEIQIEKNANSIKIDSLHNR